MMGAGDTGESTSSTRRGDSNSPDRLLGEHDSLTWFSLFTVGGGDPRALQVP